jgi:hypothetical protein
MTAAMILHDALEGVRSRPSSPALEELQRAANGASPHDRREAMELFQQASKRAETGQGLRFQEAILERALRLAGVNPSVTPRPAPETKPLAASDTIVSRGKKYIIGTTHATVATMGLQPTETHREQPSCSYQFSRKAGRSGIMDLPAGTSIVYVDVRPVYPSLPHSRRMVFRVPAGSAITIDGVATTLDHDIDVAGVANHIDPDDVYNAGAR